MEKLDQCYTMVSSTCCELDPLCLHGDEDKEACFGIDADHTLDLSYGDIGTEENFAAAEDETYVEESRRETHLHLNSNH
jgi:hypothetical protein